MDESGSGDSSFEFSEGLNWLDQLLQQVPGFSLPSAAFPGVMEGGMIVFALVALVVLAVLILGLMLFRAWLETGFLRLQLAVLQTGDESFSPLFSGADRIVDMLVSGLIVGLVSLSVIMLVGSPGFAVLGYGFYVDSIVAELVGGLVALVMILPVAIYVNLGFSMVSRAVVYDELGAVEAIKRSWEMASGNRIHLLLFVIVMGIIHMAAQFVGLLLCCIGVLFVPPLARAITSTGFSESYLLATRGKKEDWAIWNLV